MTTQRNKSNTVVLPASLLCHAGNIALRVGRTLRVDPTNETFFEDDEANALRTRPVIVRRGRCLTFRSARNLVRRTRRLFRDMIR